MKRFWDKVRIITIDGCWLWTAATAGGRGGEYGVFRLSSPRRMVYAHRFAYARLHNKDDRDLGEMMHLCDNPLCCNPLHLQEGTHQENVRDMHRKGRAGRSCKLSEHAVREIRTQLQNGKRVKDIAKRFQVTHSTVSLIKSKKIWKHI